MLRVFLAASLALPLGIQGTGQEAARTTFQSATPLTLAQVWTLNATYTDPQHGVTFRHPSGVGSLRATCVGSVRKD